MSETSEIDIYDLYKPLRNHIQKLNLQGLLELIHKVQQGHEHLIQIRPQGGFCKEVVIYRWELHTVAREALLHASLGTGQKQPNENDLVKLIRDIRHISSISQKVIASSKDPRQVFHTLTHQQVRWQHTRDLERFYRIFRIYSREDVHRLLYKVLGVRLTTIYTLTLAIMGSMELSPKILSSNYYNFMKISAEECEAYFRMVGASRADLSKSIKNSVRYNESWEFTWNPLEASPLIQLRPHHPNEYLCPLPELLLRRVTDSLFFDLGKSKESFSNPYGIAFQSYVGDVLHAQFKGATHRILEEREYWANKTDKKHGVDWIISDTTGHIMLECKTRRLPVSAKEVVDSPSLTKVIGDLAEIVVQNYKNIHDALEGKTHWEFDGKSVFPIVVTLDNWYLFAPHVVEMLESQVHDQLEEIGLSELQRRLPFIVTSIEELEEAGQAIAQIGIDRFCSKRIKSANRHFGLHMYASEAFPDIKVKYEQLFVKSDQKMFWNI